MQYSLADRRPEESVLSLLKENNIGVLIRGSLAQGLLVGKPAKDYLGHTASEIKMAAGAIQKCVNKSSNRNTNSVEICFAAPCSYCGYCRDK